MELKVAGLGEKQVVIALRATAAQLHVKILATFPKLEEGGGYVLLRCLPNSRHLAQLEAPEGGHTPQTLREDAGQARIYLRPLQRDLSLSPEQVACPSNAEVST